MNFQREQGFPVRGGYIHIHVAAAPQTVPFKFLRVLRALVRTQNTQKLVLQSVSPQATNVYGGIAATDWKALSGGYIVRG